MSLRDLIEAIDAHGQMPRARIEYLACMDFAYVSVGTPQLHTCVEESLREAVGREHPGSLAPVGSVPWLHDRLTLLADGVAGRPGLGEIDAAMYVMGATIASHGDVDAIRAIITDWAIRRAAAREADA
jgi:hypothetical protein